MKKLIFCVLLFTILLIFLINLSSKATTIYLKSGEKVKGEVAKETDEDIIFKKKLNEGFLTTIYSKDRIEKIEKEEQPDKEFLQKKEQYYLLIKMAEEYTKNNQFEKAIDYLKKANQIDPARSEVYLKLGIAYYKMENFKEAKLYFQQAIQKNPKSGEAYSELAKVYVHLGMTYVKLDNLQKALSYTQQSIQIDPNYVIAYGQLAYIYEKLGDLDKAISILKKVIQIDPEFAGAHIDLADIYKQQNKIEKAKQHYEIALRILKQKKIPQEVNRIKEILNNL